MFVDVMQLLIESNCGSASLRSCAVNYFEVDKNTPLVEMLSVEFPKEVAVAMSAALSVDMAYTILQNYRGKQNMPAIVVKNGIIHYKNQEFQFWEASDRAYLSMELCGNKYLFRGTLGDFTYWPDRLEKKDSFFSLDARLSYWFGEDGLAWKRIKYLQELNMEFPCKL